MEKGNFESFDIDAMIAESGRDKFGPMIPYTGKKRGVIISNPTGNAGVIWMPDKKEEDAD